MSEGIPFVELVHFLRRYPKQPLECFAGCYRHIRFDWVAFVQGDTDSNALINALDGIHLEERRNFVAQIIYRMVEGDDSLKQLLQMAFGQK